MILLGKKKNMEYGKCYCWGYKKYDVELDFKKDDKKDYDYKKYDKKDYDDKKYHKYDKKKHHHDRKCDYGYKHDKKDHKKHWDYRKYDKRCKCCSGWY